MLVCVKFVELFNAIVLTAYHIFVIIKELIYLVKAFHHFSGFLRDCLNRYIFLENEVGFTAWRRFFRSLFDIFEKGILFAQRVQYHGEGSNIVSEVSRTRISNHFILFLWKDFTRKKSIKCKQQLSLRYFYTSKKHKKQASDFHS